jgi:hypothetical protein
MSFPWLLRSSDGIRHIDNDYSDELTNQLYHHWTVCEVRDDVACALFYTFTKVRGDLEPNCLACLALHKSHVE